MTNPEIIRLRRFSLAFGLLLVTFSVAGVEIDSPARIAPLGIPLVLKRPDLLGIGLTLGSVYGLLRYWYYGILVGLSPRRARNRLENGTLVDGAVTMDGSSSFSIMPGFREEAKRQVDRYFPTIPGRAMPQIEVGGDDSGFHIKLTVPFYSRLLALLYDIDYYAPIWVNLIAISVYFVVFIVR